MAWRDFIVVAAMVLAVAGTEVGGACPRECACEATAIDCSYRRLTAVPIDIPATTHRL